jgi:hypothetical protein
MSTIQQAVHTFIHTPILCITKSRDLNRKKGGMHLVHNHCVSSGGPLCDVDFACRTQPPILLFFLLLDDADGTMEVDRVLQSFKL